MVTFDIPLSDIIHWFEYNPANKNVISGLKPEYRERLDALDLVSYSTRSPTGGDRLARFVFMNQDGAIAARLMVSG